MKILETTVRVALRRTRWEFCTPIWFSAGIEVAYVQHFFDKEGQLIETMNSKRSESSRTQKPTSSPRKTVAQTSLSQDVSGLTQAAQPTDVSEDSGAQAAESSEPSKVRRIQGYEADWQRWDQLAQLIGDKKQSQATLFRYLMQIADAQISEAGQGFNLETSPSKNKDLLSKETALTELMNHIPQLLSVMTSLTVQFQQNQQQQQELNLRLSQVLQALAGNGPESYGSFRSSGRKANGTTAIPKGSFAVLDSKELKKSHAKGSAEEKLKRTYEAIVAHNQAPERTHAEKWAINQNALAELTGCNRPAIKQFLKEYAAEIERHHQAHELLPRHNYAHGKLGVKIADVIAW